jgi:hypothetical protein
MPKEPGQGGTAAAKAPANVAQKQQEPQPPSVKGDGTYSPSQVRDQWTIVMSLERVTKNAVRYQEEHVVDTEPDRVGQLYLQKHNFPKGAPQRIVVTIGRIE